MADEGPSTSPSPEVAWPTRVRYRVLGMLFLLSILTFLDRVCIGSAAPLMRRDLDLTALQMGGIFSAFFSLTGSSRSPAGGSATVLAPDPHAHRDLMVGLHRSHRAGEQLPGTLDHQIPVRCRGGRRASEQLVCHRPLVPLRGASSGSSGRLDGQRIGRRDCTPDRGALAASVRLAQCLCHLRGHRSVLGNRVVPVVPRSARAEARGE